MQLWHASTLVSTFPILRRRHNARNIAKLVHRSSPKCPCSCHQKTLLQCHKATYWNTLEYRCEGKTRSPNALRANWRKRLTSYHVKCNGQNRPSHQAGHNWLLRSRIGLHINVEVWRHGLRTCNLCNSWESPWCGLHKLQVLMPCLHLHVSILMDISFAEHTKMGSQKIW